MQINLTIQRAAQMDEHRYIVIVFIADEYD